MSASTWGAIITDGIREETTRNARLATDASVARLAIVNDLLAAIPGERVAAATPEEWRDAPPNALAGYFGDVPAKVTRSLKRGRQARYSVKLMHSTLVSVYARKVSAPDRGAMDLTEFVAEDRRGHCQRTNPGSDARHLDAATRQQLFALMASVKRFAHLSARTRAFAKVCGLKDPRLAAGAQGAVDAAQSWTAEDSEDGRSVVSVDTFAESGDLYRYSPVAGELLLDVLEALFGEASVMRDRMDLGEEASYVRPDTCLELVDDLLDGNTRWQMGDWSEAMALYGVEAWPEERIAMIHDTIPHLFEPTAGKGYLGPSLSGAPVVVDVDEFCNLLLDFWFAERYRLCCQLERAAEDARCAEQAYDQDRTTRLFEASRRPFLRDELLAIKAGVAKHARRFGCGSRASNGGSEAMWAAIASDPELGFRHRRAGELAACYHLVLARRRERARRRWNPHLWAWDSEWEWGALVAVESLPLGAGAASSDAAGGAASRGASGGAGARTSGAVVETGEQGGGEGGGEGGNDGKTGEDAAVTQSEGGEAGPAGLSGPTGPSESNTPIVSEEDRALWEMVPVRLRPPPQPKGWSVNADSDECLTDSSLGEFGEDDGGVDTDEDDSVMDSDGEEGEDVEGEEGEAKTGGSAVDGKAGTGGGDAESKDGAAPTLLGDSAPMSHSTGALLAEPTTALKQSVPALPLPRSASAAVLSSDPDHRAVAGDEDPSTGGTAPPPPRPETSHLQLGHYYSGDNVITDLAEQLRSATGLEGVKRLCLAGNDVQEQGCIAIVGALENHCNITALDLDRNRIGVRGAQGLARALRSDWCGLRELVLSHNRIGDRALAALAPALHGNKQLTLLDLSNNTLGDSRAGPGPLIRDLLWANRSISELDLSWNQLRSKAATEIATALGGTVKGGSAKVNPTLKSLRLRFNSIGDAGMICLAKALGNGKTIAHLDLGLNGVRLTDTAKAVGDLVRSSAVLESLLFDGNELSDDDERMLRQANDSRAGTGKGAVLLKLEGSHVKATPRDIWGAVTLDSKEGGEGKS